jgi:NDP-sugar pyrophosphorylase family protein
MPDKITQAFILGAGLGTRLRSVTDTIPKVMIPIAEGKPLLQHTIEWLRAQGIKEFVINLHRLPEKIVSHLGDGSKFGVTMVYSDETEELLETGGAIKKAERLLRDNFLFMYGDELHFFDFGPAVQMHLEKNALATVILKKSDFPQDGEIAEINPIDKKIVRWYVRPHSISNLTSTLLLNSGLYVLSRRIIDYISAGAPVKLDGEVIPKVLKYGEPVYGFPTDERILDVGTPEKYEIAKKFYAEMVRSRALERFVK